MKTLAGLVIAVLLIIPGLFRPGSLAWAQGGSQLTEQQRREMEKKYQEEWEFQERLGKRMEDTGERLREAEKRRQDAEKRAREAERRSRELEQRRSK
jgi:membrane protein involved in colicin uptake